MTAAALLLAACERPGGWYGTTTLRHPPDELVTNNLTEPEWIDPGKCSDAVGATVITNVFEGLTQPDPKTIQPMPNARCVSDWCTALPMISTPR